MKPEYSSQTEVLKILRRRIYHGKAHDNTLDDLKAAEREILDYIDTLFMNPNPPRPNTPSVREYCLEHGVIIGDTVTLKFEALNHLIDQRVETTLKALQSADSSGSHKLTKGGWSRPVSAPKSQARTRPGGQ